ncbi:hypothetical protein LC605_17785 [Nostoc sp. CHAB 5836]|uniref:hypothetical protein n=1 Tax=Nostoc sp. CHAB 5836 TaxID=2780404 RepID=UPI001E3A60A3|nr:hypothetical protein [Nostoc sp. CHAB 5836]MCC5616893.1 hypothetical protein [Nostoc sp. CHAB 5836]
MSINVRSHIFIDLFVWQLSDRFSQRYLTANLTPLDCDRLIKVHNLGALRGIYRLSN